MNGLEGSACVCADKATVGARLIRSTEGIKPNEGGAGRKGVVGPRVYPLQRSDKCTDGIVFQIRTRSEIPFPTTQDTPYERLAGTRYDVRLELSVSSALVLARQ